MKLDTKLTAKRAWKIFLGEVNEEGLALIGDKDARELAKRSLRVAEIYSREEAIERAKQSKKKNKSSEKSTVKTKEESVKEAPVKKELANKEPAKEVVETPKVESTEEKEES